ncbi:hypothetical protein TBLA_0A00630 [Henningerozyma blattae CBS 6284]|uniref:NADP-dependent oxidoreductase domain-containing protein n=1 Tax=Henningerozyma blattae (strain ATCC 34711 / CBS 6284 / DSM 70876 / NBRC 10599 / NRRL Y-10934 / UCD 77-7) TaxID=1071380 RepID=I2GUR2_HENB6|nr:hypothetical protein TBLA_0A00630 [Tetrapisispora blattae CBS 6284]CCH57864.1 hypothetical protein TBLA_0A00630 [Tetrapisispora blattae CBS 6284]
MTAMITLNNGLKMPLVGLGCWKIPNDVCASQVYEAIKLGYRLFDGAADYGNEKEVGQGINKALSEGIVKRSDLFIISKLWNTFHHPDHVKLALQRTLSDLGLDYLDLYYIHFPLAFKYVPFEEKYPPCFYTGAEDAKIGKISLQNVPYLDTYRAMEKLVDEGLTKSIGVSNLQGSILQDVLMGCRIRPAALQIEHHPYLTQEHLVQFCKNENIAVVSYSSFGPQSFLELGSKRAEDTPALFDHPVIKKIAAAHGKDVTTSEVLLRWATQRDIAIIPKSSRKERLLLNLNVNEKLTLTEAELLEISALNKNIRFNDTWDWNNMHFGSFA